MPVDFLSNNFNRVDIATVINDVLFLTDGIVALQENLYTERKRQKRNFNFFSAIVCGKNDKNHIEKYHSNFIGYLLDKDGSHDFGDFFLRLFLSKLLDKVDLLPDPSSLILEREKQTTEGRFFDIALESRKDWLIFIENKIWSAEQIEQMSDYLVFAETYYSRYVGVYLTLNGTPPAVTDWKTNRGCLVCVSYGNIIDWLQDCLKDTTLAEHVHVRSAIEQYVTVIKNLLKMVNDETAIIKEYLRSHKQTTASVIKNRAVLNDALYSLVKEVRDKFLSDLKIRLDILQTGIAEIPATISILLKQDDYWYSGNEDKSFGMGFEVFHKGTRVKYGGEAYGQHGNSIRIASINAHYGHGIDHSNAVLLEAIDSPKWQKILTETANSIIEEVKSQVLPWITKNRHPG